MGSMSTTPLVHQAFGIDGRIKSLSDKIEECRKSDAENVIVDFSPTFGKLDAKTMERFDGDLKMTIATITEEICTIPAVERTYERIAALCTQSPFLQVDGYSGPRRDSLIKGDATAWKTDGSPEDPIVQEAASWFKEFINDKDILESIKVSDELLGRLIAHSSDTLADLTTASKETETQKSLDIAGIRYPDFERPCFRVFRIHLTMRTSSKGEGMNGILGDITVMQYGPRHNFLAGLGSGARNKALQSAETFWAV